MQRSALPGEGKRRRKEEREREQREEKKEKGQRADEAQKRAGSLTDASFCFSIYLVYASFSFARSSSSASRYAASKQLNSKSWQWRPGHHWAPFSMLRFTNA